jgi:hypothetical protein
MTREKLGDAIGVAPLPALNLKGFSEHVVAFELKAIRSTDAPEETE